MSNVFNRQDYEALKAAQRKLHDLLPLLDSAESCGLECQDLRQAHKDFADKLSKVEAEFFTPPPS